MAGERGDAPARSGATGTLRAVTATRERVIHGVVLAAGSGQRYGGWKQYELLAGERLVDRAVRLVQAVAPSVTVVLPPGHEWEGPPVTAAVGGGSSRTESMRRAMDTIDDATDIVVVHDSIRPLATLDLVHRLIEAIEGGADAAIPCWELPDTVKSIRPDGTLEHRGREEFVIAQGPAAYRYRTIRRVFEELAEIPIEETIGIELIGGRVVPVKGNKWSHHVVDPEDLRLMQWLVEQIGP